MTIYWFILWYWSWGPCHDDRAVAWELMYRNSQKRVVALCRFPSFYCGRRMMVLGGVLSLAKRFCWNLTNQRKTKQRKTEEMNCWNSWTLALTNGCVLRMKERGIISSVQPTVVWHSSLWTFFSFWGFDAYGSRSCFNSLWTGIEIEMTNDLACLILFDGMEWDGMMNDWLLVLMIRLGKMLKRCLA